MGFFLAIRRLKCVQPDDDLTDEVIMQQDGVQVWPPTGVHSMSTGNEISLNLDLSFNGPSTSIRLQDDEDLGLNDELGTESFFTSEHGSGLKTKDFFGEDGSHYIMTYAVGKKEDF
jgi:hypothetical protein